MFKLFKKRSAEPQRRIPPFAYLLQLSQEELAELTLQSIIALSFVNNEPVEATAERCCKSLANHLDDLSSTKTILEEWIIRNDG